MKTTYNLGQNNLTDT